MLTVFFARFDAQGQGTPLAHVSWKGDTLEWVGDPEIIARVRPVEAPADHAAAEAFLRGLSLTYNSPYLLATTPRDLPEGDPLLDL